MKKFKPKIRVIVAGSRTFNDAKLMDQKLTAILSKLDKKRLIIVNGYGPGGRLSTGHPTKGADRMADAWALKHWITVERHHAEWDKHGKAAGMIRNSAMLKESIKLSGAKRTFLVVFWNGVSPGTRDMMRKAKEAGITVRVILFDDED